MLWISYLKNCCIGDYSKFICLFTHSLFLQEAGKRSQLWRMTPSGMLEHEGHAPPMDPRKMSSSGSRHRLVLDIADIALQPGKPIPLALKKTDERRVAKQTWKFKVGTLIT